MKIRLFTATAVALAFSNTGSGAAEPPAAFTWTGFYAGINGGYGGGTLDTTQTILSPPAGPWALESQAVRSQTSFGDFFVGGQIGYNYQFANRIVLGVETDMQWSALKLQASAAYDHMNAGPGFFFLNNFNGQARYGQEWYGTTRLRIGYALTDRFLPYITGGVAYSSITGDIGWLTAATGFGVTSITRGSSSDVKVGWTLGAGVEYAFTNRLTFKTEYLYSEYEGHSVPVVMLHDPTTGNTGAGPLSAATIGVHTLRAGLNWKFGNGGFLPEIAADDLLALPKGPSSAAPFAWTGFYVGVNGGYGGGLFESQLSQAQALPGASLEAQFIRSRFGFGDFFVGGQAGYNFQLPNKVVLGLETDMQWSAVRLNIDANYSDAIAGAPGFGTTLRGQGRYGQDWFGSTRVRFGYALGDRFMPYVTGGVAYSNISGDIVWGTAATGVGTTSFLRTSGSDTKVGWTAGAGVEYAVTDRLTVKTEYLYSEFGGVDLGGGGILNTFGVSPAISTAKVRDLGISAVRAGLNWKFCDGPNLLAHQ